MNEIYQHIKEFSLLQSINLFIFLSGEEKTLKSFDSEYNVSPEKEITKKYYYYHLEPNENTIWVHDCSFRRIHSCTDSGGIIKYVTTNGQILVEMSIFYECFSDFEGGALSLAGIRDSIVQQCCSVKCYTTSPHYGGQFILSELSDDVNNKNRLRDSSVTYSMKDFNNPSGGQTVDFRNGAIQVNLVNISRNIGNYNTVLYFKPSLNTENTIAYTTIDSNDARYFSIINLNTNTNYEFSHSNIINNIDDAPASFPYSYLIQCYGPTNYDSCCLMNNTASYIIYSIQQSTLTNCSFDSELTSKTMGVVSITETPDTSFTIPNVFTHTQNGCFVEYYPPTLEKYSNFNHKIEESENASAEPICFIFNI